MKARYRQHQLLIRGAGRMSRDGREADDRAGSGEGSGGLVDEAFRVPSLRDTRRLLAPCLADTVDQDRDENDEARD